MRQLFGDRCSISQINGQGTNVTLKVGVRIMLRVNLEFGKLKFTLLVMEGMVCRRQSQYSPQTCHKSSSKTRQRTKRTTDLASTPQSVWGHCHCSARVVWTIFLHCRHASRIRWRVTHPTTPSLSLLVASYDTQGIRWQVLEDFILVPLPHSQCNFSVH